MSLSREVLSSSVKRRVREEEGRGRKSRCAWKVRRHGMLKGRGEAGRPACLPASKKPARQGQACCRVCRRVPQPLLLPVCSTCSMCVQGSMKQVYGGERACSLLSKSPSLPPPFLPVKKAMHGEKCMLQVKAEETFKAVLAPARSMRGRRETCPCPS